MMQNKKNRETEPDPKILVPFKDLAVHSPSSFKRSVNMMRRFNSYEEYLETMTRMMGYATMVDEAFQSMKTEPVEPNPLTEVKR